MSSDTSPPCPPELIAWRETTLGRFSDPADRAAFLHLGGMLHRYALDRTPVGSEPAVHGALRCVAADLRNLQAFLEWIVAEGDETEIGISQVAMTTGARTYGEDLGRIATAIEQELGLSAGQADHDSPDRRAARSPWTDEAFR